MKWSDEIELHRKLLKMMEGARNLLASREKEIYHVKCAPAHIEIHQVIDCKDVQSIDFSFP